VWIYFFFVVMLGGFFIVQLFLAVMYDDALETTRSSGRCLLDCA
jgi:hypothetical protein